MAKKIIMALDLSSKSSGVAIFEDQKLIHYECITSFSTDSLARIKKMTKRVRELYDQYAVTNVIAEDILPADVNHNHNVFRTLHYLQAAVVLELHSSKQKVEFYTSTEWRSKCGIHTGRGTKRDALKAADIQFVKDQYGIEVNDDIADAIGIGYAYTHSAADTGFEFR